jgi:hypothetical protein
MLGLSDITVKISGVFKLPEYFFGYLSIAKIKKHRFHASSSTGTK